MNYKKVIEDFASGKLDRNKVTLVMDNDGGYWNYNGFTGEESKFYAESFEKRYGSPGGYEDVVDILNAAGVNADWC